MNSDVNQKRQLGILFLKVLSRLKKDGEKRKPIVRQHCALDDESLLLETTASATTRWAAWSRSVTSTARSRATCTDPRRCASTPAINNIRFQGQYLDGESGLHYDRHRHYDPRAGRYVSKDPIGLKGGLNIFGYVPNPVQAVDRLGLAGAIPKNFGKGKPINPLLNPINSVADSQGKTSDFVDAVKGFFVFDTKTYFPDDTLSCVLAIYHPGKTCTPNGGVKTEYTGRNKIDKPIGGEPFTWPPAPADMPEGCTCKVEEIRKNMSGLRPPGL